MVKLFQELEYGHYQVKPLSFKGVLGLLLKLLLVEILAMFVMMPLATLINEGSLMYLVLSELIAKGLVLWMLIRFYREEVNPLVLAELMEDAFGDSAEVPSEEVEVKILPRKVFAWGIVLIIVGFRLFYDNSLAYVLTDNIPVSEDLVEALDELFAWPVYAIFSVVFIAPFYEEILFRKFMLGGLLKRIRPFWAIVISAVFFGFIHLNWLQGINAFLLGLIIGWIYYGTKSLSLCIFAHFINNFYAMSFGLIQEGFLPEPLVWANAILCVFGGVLIVVSKERIEKLLVEFQ